MYIWELTSVSLVDGRVVIQMIQHMLCYILYSECTQNIKKTLKIIIKIKILRTYQLQLKIHIIVLAGVAQWIEHWPVNQEVASSIPSLGTFLGCGPGPQ